MYARAPDSLELEDAWIESDDASRWSSASVHGSGTGARESASSMLEVSPGCRLPRHTDSAEETIVVLEGAATVVADGERSDVPAGGLAVIPEGVPHEVRNAGDRRLRFAAIYAAADVVTTYESEVEPGGERERESSA